MTDRENFLERWSRRKREAADAAAGEPPPSADPPMTQSVASAPEQSAPSVRDEGAPPAPSVPPAPAPEFDLSKLPSLDSITAASDVRAFLAPGVPQHLARAALRRAWTADPAIRDFVGLQENDWDFTKPDSIPGFGDIAPGYDVKKVVAQLFGGEEAPHEIVPQATPPAHSESTAESQLSTEPTGTLAPPIGSEQRREETTEQARGAPSASAKEHIVRRENVTASQYLPSQEEPKHPKPARKHGGALPEC
jgi:hypothetical protein